MEGLVVAHLTMARIAEALAVSWSTVNDAVLAEDCPVRSRCRPDPGGCTARDRSLRRRPRRGYDPVSAVADDGWPTDVELEDAWPDAEEREATAAPATVPNGPQLYHPSVVLWYAEWFRHAYKRRIDSRSRLWAGDWWRYNEALLRLDALWRVLEHPEATSRQ